MLALPKPRNPNLSLPITAQLDGHVGTLHVEAEQGFGDRARALQASGCRCSVFLGVSIRRMNFDVLPGLGQRDYLKSSRRRDAKLSISPLWAW